MAILPPFHVPQRFASTPLEPLPLFWNQFPQGLRNARILYSAMLVHGNTGDKLETQPLLEALRKLQPATLDCSFHGASRGIHPAHRPMLQHCDAFFFEYRLKEHVNCTDYDAIIVAPGPAYRTRYNCPDLPYYFMGTAFKDFGHIQPWESVAMVQFREPESHLALHHAATVKQVSIPFPVLWSGDFTFNYVINESRALQHYHRFRQDHGDNACLVFVRSNNQLHTLLQREEGSREVVITSALDGATYRCPATATVVASSTAGESDGKYVPALAESLGLPYMFLEDAEEVFGAVAAAAQVLSDRYHPCVATARVGRNVPTVLPFKRHPIKLDGISRLLLVPHSDILERNAKVFTAMVGDIAARLEGKGKEKEWEVPE